MKFFEKHSKLKDLLKKSEQNFGFERDEIRKKLMSELKSQHFGVEKNRLLGIDRSKYAFSHKLAFGLTSLILFVGLGSTLAVANTAKPGDKLFALDQVQEKFILKMPLPEQTKSEIRTNIVAERASELQELSELPNNEEVKAKAVETSQQSLTNAVEEASENRNRLQKKGKSVEKINRVLNRLEALGEEQEKKADEIKEKIKSVKLRNEVDVRVGEIKKARLKARLEMIKDLDPKVEGETKDSDENRGRDNDRFERSND